MLLLKTIKNNDLVITQISELSLQINCNIGRWAYLKVKEIMWTQWGLEINPAASADCG